MEDVQAIYAVLLARGYQDQLFLDLGGIRKREKGGRETLVTCPFCQKERHFSYNRDKPVWRCLHCNEAGDWIGYLKKGKGLEFKDALLYLAQAAGLDVSRYDQARYHDLLRRDGGVRFLNATLEAGDLGLEDLVCVGCDRDLVAHPDRAQADGCAAADRNQRINQEQIGRAHV